VKKTATPQMTVMVTGPRGIGYAGYADEEVSYDAELSPEAASTYVLNAYLAQVRERLVTKGVAPESVLVHFFHPGLTS
jgi:hypothetical protein